MQLAEWLCDVVIRARVQSADHISLPIARCEHHDRHVRFLPNTLADVQTVRVREAEVQDYKVRIVGESALEAAATVGLGNDRTAVEIDLETKGDNVEDVGVT